MDDCTELDIRFDAMMARLQDAYDSIGHSSGRPYLYFVYKPSCELYLARLIADKMHPIGNFQFLSVDLLALTLDSLAGQEERRTEILNDPAKGANAAQSILRMWARRLSKEIETQLATIAPTAQPIVVLRGMAALHPIGNPTNLMEAIAEQEPRNPHSGRIVPVVLFVPGIRPPQTSREYLYLGLENQRLTFYRGEEI